MSRIRSPGYPSIPLKEAIDLVRKLYDHSRHNVTDRDAAVKDLGYKGITGQSAKMLANLSHFGLVEKAGKGGIKVTDMAAKILHPHTPQERATALLEAAYEPGLFFEIKEQWPDGFVSENALRAYLMRKGFASVAVHPVMKAYFETYDFLRQENATESHGERSAQEAESSGEDFTGGAVPSDQRGGLPALIPPPLASAVQGAKLMAGERVVFSEETGPSQSLRLIAVGDLDVDLLEALEDYVKRQKRRLTKLPAPDAS